MIIIIFPQPTQANPPWPHLSLVWRACHSPCNKCDNYRFPNCNTHPQNIRPHKYGHHVSLSFGGSVCLWMRSRPQSSPDKHSRQRQNWISVLSIQLRAFTFPNFKRPVVVVNGTRVCDPHGGIYVFMPVLGDDPKIIIIGHSKCYTRLSIKFGKNRWNVFPREHR